MWPILEKLVKNPVVKRVVVAVLIAIANELRRRPRP